METPAYKCEMRTECQSDKKPSMGRSWNSPIITTRKDVMIAKRDFHMRGNPRAGDAEFEMRTQCQVRKIIHGLENPDDHREERGKRR